MVQEAQDAQEMGRGIRKIISFHREAIQFGQKDSAATFSCYDIEKHIFSRKNPFTCTKAL